MLKNIFVIKDHKIKSMVVSSQVFQDQRFKFCFIKYLYTE